jgi:hypothetical protein
MKIFAFAFFIIMFVSPALWSQERIQKLIHGKILADSATVEGIEVINLVNEKSTTTNKNGEFFILAKAGEVLVFSAVNLEFKRKLIEEEDLKSEVVIINMIPKITELKEVIINKYPEINAVSLGIVPKGQKTYTPAERKLYAASSTPLDGLLNSISGRTAMLKKELIVEGKEQLLSKVEVLYEDKYYIETLKIPSDYIRDFQYYIIEDAGFVSALKSKNKTMTMFLAVKLAVSYNELSKKQKQ